MYIIFIDESGYSYNWLGDANQQPFYVLSAVAIPANELNNLYTSVLLEHLDLGLRSKNQKVGLNYEIKAKDVINKKNKFWRDNPEKRSRLLKLYPSLVKQHKGVGFIVAINKQSHINKYRTPGDPSDMALTYVFERISMFLSSNNEYAICIYDQNKKIEDRIHDSVTKLREKGSRFGNSVNIHKNDDPTDLANYALIINEVKMDRIIDFALGKSNNSIGIQIADFYASMTYQYLKSNKVFDKTIWDILYNSLHSKDGRVDGFGFKTSP
jgi:hypothetical protein